MNKKTIAIITFSILLIILICISIYFSYSNHKIGNEIASVHLYKNLIDTYLNNNNLLTNCNYISIDVTSLIDPSTNNKLSDNSKNEILNYCKKYINNVYSEKIQDDSLMGLNIDFYISGKNKNKFNIDIKYSLSNSNIIGGRTYICIYNNVWTVNDKGNAWSS